jgi:hypothetical protein
MQLKDKKNIDQASYLEGYFYNVCFFVLIFFFYNMILKVCCFWDQLYFDMVENFINEEANHSVETVTELEVAY